MLRVLAVAVLAATPALAAEKGFAVGSFDRISLGGSPEVTVTTGKTPSVVATGDQRALDRLEIKVEDGKLSIGSKRGTDWSAWRGWGKVRIAVTTPMVRGVELGGSGSVAIDRIKVAKFEAQVGGSGSIAIASLDTDKAEFELGGSGSATAVGRCDAASVSVAGSGALRLGGLKCSTLAVELAGSGQVAAFATRSASVSVAGSGSVRVAGGAKCTVSKFGSGSVNCAV